MTAKPRRHAADRLFGTGRSAGEEDLPDLDEDEVLWSEEDVCRRGVDHRRFKLAAGALSFAFGDGSSPDRRAAASTPVKVPVWPGFIKMAAAVAVEGEEEGGGWVPPHEYLAREKGRSGSTSVLEGAGRTLKGRDVIRCAAAVDLLVRQFRYSWADEQGF
ncbi:hypothetical protein ZIOFF_022615 [Zingiber officinale]|uniref:Uncharacterized protein n=1 Tax=Zingiber officinale TaxID=94328 RepID=A0A8J5HLR1_ZINOF|nr:hypothetical protein ZIOFF_022615 [Zingiber officinale]